MMYEIPDADPLTGAVQQLFGLSYLFPYQRLAIANILEAAAAAGIPIRWPGEPAADPPEDAEDTMADAIEDQAGQGRQIVILPTGAGKSLCFQLPAMLMDGPTLVIYPILSLMADQERRLRDRGFPLVTLRGGQSREERDIIWNKLRTGESRFIIANPEVLLSPQVMDRLGGLGIVHVVIDEAHCVSEWGESFRPAYLEIGKILEAVARPREGGRGKLPLVTAFTATAGAPVLEKIERYIFGGEKVRRIIGNPDRSNISYAAQGCILRDPAVRDLLRRSPRPAIVFCSSRSGVEKLARYLRNELEDREIRFYHAGLSREEKTGVETWFFPNPQGVLVSTCAYGMGVDKADIRTVIHRDCPPSVEAYLQESGRAGRDGLQSQAILFWGPGDQMALNRTRSLADRRRLSSLLDYAKDTGNCRRRALLALLNYEGDMESPEERCCDVCEGRAREELREVPPLTGFFRRNQRRYTIKEATPLLTGQTGWSEEELRQVLKRLLEDRVLQESKNWFWKKKLICPRA